jgi:hypothetical protein
LTIAAQEPASQENDTTKAVNREKREQECANKLASGQENLSLTLEELSERI